MNASTRTRWAAAALIIAPVVIWVSFLAHPHIGTAVGDPGLHMAIASEVATAPGAWVFAHLLLAVGSGLLALAFIGLRGYLGDAGEDRFSAVGLPFVVLGSVLFALLPAMEMAPFAAYEAGVDAAAVQAALDATVFPPVLLAGSVLFGIGAVAFAAAVPRSGVLSPGPAKAVAAALVVVAVSRFVPVFFVLFHVQSVALIGALWPLAYVMWTGLDAGPAGSAEPAAPPRATSPGERDAR